LKININSTQQKRLPTQLIKNQLLKFFQIKVSVKYERKEKITLKPGGTTNCVHPNRGNLTVGLI
jgi:hypothetical protein